RAAWNEGGCSFDRAPQAASILGSSFLCERQCELAQVPGQANAIADLERQIERLAQQRTGVGTTPFRDRGVGKCARRAGAPPSPTDLLRQLRALLEQRYALRAISRLQRNRA